MKRILIIALCFISLLNAADTKEIECAINGIIYKGYRLSNDESAVYSFVGINTQTTWSPETTELYTTIVAQVRDDEECYELYTFDSNGKAGVYKDRDGMKGFSMSGNTPSKTKAIALHDLYITAQRAATEKQLYHKIKKQHKK